MGEKEFNLIYEPWILVLNADGEPEELSLLDAFRRAGALKSLAGELPTQDIAVLRLLLAILYAVFTRLDVDGSRAEIATTPEALARWRKLYEKGSFPYGMIEDYLKYYAERFYLFHPETPFYQVANLRKRDKKEELNPIAQIIADVPSRDERRFFTNLSGEATQTLAFAEAARWLVNLQAWDYAGKKAAIIGGVENGGGTGWLGKVGVVYLQGSNLFETLMLNLVMVDRKRQVITFSSPVWENKPVTAAKTDVRPESFVELLTWQSRRISLFKEGKRVVGVLSSYGDVFAKEDTFFEFMSGWKKGKDDKFLPHRHNANRSMWRDLGAILPQRDDQNGQPNPGDISCPGVISWLEELKSADREAFVFANIHIHIAGLEYGPMDGVIDTLISDSLSVNAGLFDKINEEWVRNIEDIIERTDGCVKKLGNLAKDIVKASGVNEGNPNGKTLLRSAGEAAREQTYFMLDNPFRWWLANVDPKKDDRGAAMAAWLEQMKAMVLEQGERLVREAGAKALVGKSMTENAITAYRRFRSGIKKILAPSF